MLRYSILLMSYLSLSSFSSFHARYSASKINVMVMIIVISLFPTHSRSISSRVQWKNGPKENSNTHKHTREISHAEHNIIDITTFVDDRKINIPFKILLNFIQLAFKLEEKKIGKFHHFIVETIGV